MYSTSATQIHPLGARGEDAFGRTWRYCRVGASDLVVGNAIQSPAQAANHQDLTPSAAAIGATSITVTLGATATTANQYADGIAVIDTTPGLGYSYPIRTHEAAASEGSQALTLVPGWAIAVALTTTSRVSLYPNPYRGVIQSPVTTLTGVCVGVCQYIIADTEYGWLGTGGIFGTLIQGTPDVGEMVSTPTSVAGAVNDYAAGSECPVGHMMDTGQDGKVEAVRWFLG